MNLTYSDNKGAVAVVILTMILVALDRMNLGGAVIITFYWACIKTFSWSKNHNRRLQASLVIAVISIALVAHKIPGFHNILFYKDVHISNISALYSAYINFDKPFLMLLLTYCYARNNIWQNPLNLLYQSLLIGIIASGVLLAPALLSGYLKFDPKIPEIFWGWGVLNIITIVSEEALFRGFIQNALNEVFSSSKIKYHSVLSLIIASALFALMHHQGGTIYVALSFIAGLFYGYALILTKRIEASIIVHFTVNLVHILFFTYPYSL
jgi:membrane protease YdiL (CAAX protease family)